MKVTLHGASGGEVTGSAYLVETGSANVLVEAEMPKPGQTIEIG
jgi:hypothetical protein